MGQAATPCPICTGPRRALFRKTFLGRHEAPLDWCAACGFLQVRAPFWLAEAYDTAIAALDTGLVARNLGIANRLAGLLPLLGDTTGPFLDAGGGIGLLVRLMRDRGFDFRWSDAHAANLLARGFTLGAGEAAVAVTAIEVLEHCVDPVGFVAEVLAVAGTRTLIFTTETYAGTPRCDWWYLAPEGGQHIAFFRQDTLAALGARLGLALHSYRGLHMLTDRAIAARAYRWRTGWLAPRIARSARGSLVASDHALLLARGGR